MKLALILLTLIAAAPARALSNEQLTVGISQEFETLNPLIAQMAASTYMYYTVGRPITALNAKWEWTCVLCKELPSLEKGSAKVINEGGKKKMLVSFEIIPEAKWGDGTPLTARDFAFSVEVGKSPKVSVGGKDTFEKIEAVQIDPANPKKFTLKLSEARYDFVQFGSIALLPVHLEGPVWEKSKNETGAYEKQTKYSTDSLNPGLYAGPYVVKEIKLGSHVLVEANPHFYGKKPAIKKIVFRLIPNTQTMEANLLSGTIDMISELGIAFDQALALEKRVKRDAALKSKINVVFREGMVYEHIDLNLRNPIFKDIRVRKALMHAIDREKLTQALFEGRQKPALHNIHPLDPYYTDQVAKYDFDMTKAAALLDEAGYKLGADGVRAKDGKKLSLVFMTTAQNKTRELVQVFLQEEYKKLGVAVQIKNEPARVFFGETVRKGAFPHLAMFAWVSSPDSPPLSTMHSKNIPTAKNAFSGQNSGAYSNKEVDSALDKIFTEFDFNKRKALMATLQKRYAEDLPVIPLYLRSEIAVAPASLSGYEITGHQSYSTLSVENWDLSKGMVTAR
jgi:peptide/nickel transport system substrate-binding protein